jgi:DNA-binding response OmpR family regulator
MGYRVIGVSHGEDAILKAKQIVPDIVLVDIYLANKDGYQVAREIKRDSFLGNAHVILLNSAFATLNKKKALKARVDGVIIKPFGPEIVEKVGSLLDHGETAEIRFIPIIHVIHAWEISKRHAAKLTTSSLSLIAGIRFTCKKSFAVMIQTSVLNINGTYRLASAFAEKAEETCVKNIMAVKKSLRFPPVRIGIKEYGAEFKMAYDTLVSQSKRAHSKFNSIAQTAAGSTKDYCQTAKEFTANLRMTIGKLKHPKTPTLVLNTKSLTFPSAHLLGRRFAAKFETLFKQPLQQKQCGYSKFLKTTRQSIAGRLKESYQPAMLLAADLKTTVEKLRYTNAPAQRLMTRSLSILSRESITKKYVLEYEVLGKKLAKHTKYNYSKYCTIINESSAKRVKDYRDEARAFMGSVMSAVGRLRERKIAQRIITLGSLEPSLMPLFFTRGSLISVISMGVILLITTFIPSSSRNLEGTSLFFNRSMSATELAEREANSNFEGKLYDDADDKKPEEKELSEVPVKQNTGLSRRKTKVAKNKQGYSQRSKIRGNNRTWKIKDRSGHESPPRKNLEEVLREAFLLQ